MTLTLLARRSPDGRQLIVNCPGCGQQHYHGRHDGTCGALDPFGRTPCTCPTGAGDGHRAAHCQHMPGGYRLCEATR